MDYNRTGNHNAHNIQPGQPPGRPVLYQGPEHQERARHPAPDPGNAVGDGAKRNLLPFQDQTDQQP